MFVSIAVPNKSLAWRKLPLLPKRNPETAVQSQKAKADSNNWAFLDWEKYRPEIQHLEGCQSQTPEKCLCTGPLEPQQDCDTWNSKWQEFFPVLGSRITCQDKKEVKHFGNRGMFPFTGAALSPEVDLQFIYWWQISWEMLREMHPSFSTPPAHRHMEAGIGHIFCHRWQALPHLQLLPSHSAALSPTLSLPLAPVAEAIAYSM